MINEKHIREPRIHRVRPPRIKTNCDECNLLFQIIKINNTLRSKADDTTLRKIELNTEAPRVIGLFLDAYDPVCRLSIYFIC